MPSFLPVSISINFFFRPNCEESHLVSDDLRKCLKKPRNSAIEMIMGFLGFLIKLLTHLTLTIKHLNKIDGIFHNWIKQITNNLILLIY